MQPFLKWAGGKDKEMKFIFPFLPERYNDFYEPFVGGGSVFAALDAGNYFINDFSPELIRLYQSIADADAGFYLYARLIDGAWANADRFMDIALPLSDMFMAYRRNELTEDGFLAAIDRFCRRHLDAIDEIVDRRLAPDREAMRVGITDNLRRKLVRMREIERRKNSCLSDTDVWENIRTAVKSAVYMHFRSLYNNQSVTEANPSLATALFLFIRNYCYSGMFRYNAGGEFNVPYGGMAYNSKSLGRKLDYYSSREVERRMANTVIECLDFETFFYLHEPAADDFVFLDPPYDSEFSTYAQKEFTRADHLRLANLLVNRCRAQWMLVIKNTDFIYHLYDHPHINIHSFDKTYQVSFMNRNDRSAEHLIITNYNRQPLIEQLLCP